MRLKSYQTGGRTGETLHRYMDLSCRRPPDIYQNIVRRSDIVC